MPGPEARSRVGPVLPPRTARARRTVLARTAAARPSAWRISLALLVCFCIVVSALHTVLQDFGWWFAMCGTILAVLGAAALSRAVGIRPRVPTLVGSLVLLGILTVFFAARTALLFVVPTLGTLARFGDLGQAGALSISGQSVPAEPTEGILFLLCLGAGALAVVADLIAVTWRLPALAGVPLAVILAIPTFIGIELADVFVFVLAAVGWLVLLRAGQPFPQTGRAIGIGAAAIALALIAPLVLPQVDESEASGDGFSGYLASVNPVLDLGADLRRELPRTILSYSTLSGDPAYLRLVSLQNFTAETWEPDPPVIDRDNVPSAVGPVPGLAAEVKADDETTWVDINNLGSPWLPVPYPVTGVSGLRGDWFWGAEDLTFTSPDRPARGEVYRASSLTVRPTPAQLTSAGTVVPGDFGKYLALPDGLPAIIGDTAHQVTASAQNDYGKAVALQEYFRDGSFAYSETAPVDQGYDGNGMAVIAKFLVARSGYCVHFASAMAVMARTLGIPSRVAVGFLPGTKKAELDQGRTAYRVTTQDVHSWPELYFEGIGWTRFEPTPGRGFVPTYADEATPGVPIPPSTTPTATSSPSPTAAPSRTAVPVDPNDSAATAGGAESWLGWLWAGLVALGAVLLLLVPAVVRMLQRRIRMRRLARGSPAAATGWRELLQTAEDLGFDIGATATPRAAARLIARAARLGATDAEVLASTLDAVERESFARPSGRRAGPGDSGAARSGAARPGLERVAQVGRIAGRLRSAASLRVRVLAALAPRSIWSRLAGLLGMPGARTAAISRVD